MQKKINFNENLEKGLAKIGHRVAENIERGELRTLPEREAIKRSIQSIAEMIPPVSPTPHNPPQSSSPHLPAYMNDDGVTDDMRHAVERLVAIALGDDLEKAVKESKKYPAFIEDAFHDALVDKLVPELREKGILGQS
jgi:hypothetical protein